MSGCPWRLFFLTVAVLLLGAAAVSAAVVNLVPQEQPIYGDDLRFRGLEEVLAESVAYLQGRPANTRLTWAGPSVTVGQLLAAARRMQRLVRTAPGPEALNTAIRMQFRAVRMVPDDPVPNHRRLLVTGYYQPHFTASLTRTPPFLYPVYACPDSLVVRESGGRKTIGRLVDGVLRPFWTRREIEQGNLLAGSEMVWLADPFDVFVLHVQGSAILHLTDGSRRGIHYAERNGRTYRSIGTFLVRTGRMELAEVTMDTIRDYLARHPEERDLILHQNDSFIFFHWTEAGPAVGNLGRPLTAGRSIAVDQRWYPPGALAYLESLQPVFADGVMTGWQQLQRFVSVQDTGSALVGPGRMDLFWGSGEQAGRAAGRMKEDGELYLLLPREKQPDER
jgi:membrane-bound lytic murein transglycosylase A